ncbi:MAG: helix-turn-helix transcriptional regulator [Clostridia bacterium]|nr:helix-turn-helix transcriptional regulator [Clostridia bacterium]
MKNQFASRLNELIQEREISKRNLAKNIGVSAMSISDWTNGNVQPTAENIYLIAEYLGVTSDYLLGLEDDTGSKKSNH